MLCIVLGRKIERNLLNMDICTPRIITTLLFIFRFNPFPRFTINQMQLNNASFLI